MRYKAISFHPHASGRMAKRYISQNQVKRALNSPEAHFYENEGKQVCEVTTQTGALLRVVFIEISENSAHVITAVRIGK